MEVLIRPTYKPHVDYVLSNGIVDGNYPRTWVLVVSEVRKDAPLVPGTNECLSGFWVGVLESFESTELVIH